MDRHAYKEQRRLSAVKRRDSHCRFFDASGAMQKGDAVLCGGTKRVARSVVGRRARSVQYLASSVLLTIALLASGCTFTDDLTGQVGRINKSVEQVQNEAILHNVIRASEGAPLNFTQLMVVRGSGTVSATLGLPTIPFGPGTVRQQKEAAGVATASSNTNFDLGVLESKEFWLGLQTPLRPETLDFFIREGLPREILFYLYIESIVLDTGTATRVLVNDPASPTFPEFVAELRAVLYLGLTTETMPDVVQYGPPLPAAKASDMRDIVELAKAGLRLRRTSTSAGSGYQVESVQTTTRLCFNPGLALGDIRYLIGKQSTCEAMGPTGASRGENTSENARLRPFRFIRRQRMGATSDTAVTIYPRSTLGIFRYLGILTKTGARIEMLTEEARSFGTGAPSQELFVVDVNSRGVGSFVSVRHRGVSYSIPMRETATIHILTLLRRLVALSTSVNALPTPNTVTTIVP